MRLPAAGAGHRDLVARGLGDGQLHDLVRADRGLAVELGDQSLLQTEGSATSAWAVAAAQVRNSSRYEEAGVSPSRLGII